MRLPRTFTLALVLGLPLAHAADYWVSTTGNDGGPGTQSQPWRTIQRAVNQPVQPGDTVHVMPGTYVGFWTDIPGTSNQPITWRSETTGAAIINQPPSGTGIPCNSGDNVCLHEANYNVVDGFEVTAAPRAGIAVRGLDPTLGSPIVGAVVRNCESHDNGRWGIFDSYADDCLYEYNTCSGSALEHGIYHSNSGDRTTIRFNTVFNNNAAGLHNNGDGTLPGDGICSNLLIEGNVIYANGSAGGAAINMDGVQDSIVRNNLIYAHQATGIAVYRIDGAAPSYRNVIVNNTVIMSDAAGSRWALSIVDGSAPGCVVFNNVLYRNDSWDGSINIDSANPPGFLSDRNVVVDRFSVDDESSVISLAAWQATTGQDANSMLIDPSTLATFFADPAANDWHLRSGSPAIDTGGASLGGKPAPTSDYEGDSRPQGGLFDIGCDEYATAGAPVADFSGSPLTGPAPLTVQFTDLSTGTINAWSWTFGDGGTSTAQNPSHVYTTTGSFTVSLTVTGPGGTDTDTKPAYVIVTGGGPIENFFSGRGRGAPNPNDVRIHSLGGVQEAAWAAYAAGQWGTLAAAGDIDGNTLDNPITGPGPGALYGPQVRGFQPSGASIAKVNFYAYGTLRYGVNVASGDMDGDAPEEMLSGAGPGAVFGPHVRGWNFDGLALSSIAKISFFAYSTLRYGVNVDKADLDRDGYHEILTGPGPSGAFGPQVRGFNYDGVAVAAMAKVNFNAWSSGGGGANVAGGDVEADLYDEIAVGRGMGSGSGQIRGFNYDGTSVSPLPGFDMSLAGTGGAHPALGDIDADSRAELVAGEGEDPSAPSAVSSFDYTGSALTPVTAGTFTAFAGGYYGTIPATGVFGY